MYTSYIGKKFLKLYNKKNNKNYSAEDFFNEVIFPLFFNDDRHFLNVANSSFFQKVAKDNNENKTIHEIKLERFHKNIKEDGASLTTMVGYASQDIRAGTSSQVSSLKTNISDDEIYASWIGAGLSIAMGGGFAILLDNELVLESLFAGWEYYRKVLTQTPNLKGNQIDTWNAYWLCYVLSDNYDESMPFDNFQFPNLKPCVDDKLKKKGYVEFESNNWAKIIFAISKKFSNQTITVNAFKFEKTNTTLGFIKLYLPEVHKFYEFRDKLFIAEDETILSDHEIESLSTYYTFKDACAQGTIGMRALEPANLRQYLPKGTVRYAKGEYFKFKNTESIKQYQLFKIWIIAMINKAELLQAAEFIAGVLVEIENKQDKRGKKDAEQSSKTFLEIKNLKSFVEGLTLLLGKTDEKEKLKEFLREIILMPSDSFPLFMALIKFEYSYKLN